MARWFSIDLKKTEFVSQYTESPDTGGACIGLSVNRRRPKNKVAASMRQASCDAGGVICTSELRWIQSDRRSRIELNIRILT